ncbi:MAG: lysine--tRNA ligase [Candidatus Babeliaceae bacterium]|nr:lysine--tRNA ligase [Candidatus Babeliaceae bacterium]
MVHPDNKRLEEQEDIKEQHPDISESNEHLDRIKKVHELRAHGIEPWPARHEKITSSCKQILEAKAEDTEYSLAGRIMTMRAHGKAIFCHLQDATGQLQLYIKEDVIGEATFALCRDYLDIGDIVWVRGITFTTKVGEFTLRVLELVLLSKSLHPLPEKFHGLADVEIKLRQRYLDLITNEETRERFRRRSQIIAQLRSFLDNHGYIEVETPMLQPIPGGAAAKPFVTHHNALDMELFLRIAPELYLKRLLVGGFEKVYEINRNFRNEGISTRHNPEFTMLEFYTAYRDYHYIMDFVTTMFRELVLTTCGTLQAPFGDKTINFDNFRRLSPEEAVIEFGSIPKAELSPEKIDATCQRMNIKISPSENHQKKIFTLFEACAESRIVDPVFIVEFPIDISPLARRDDKNPLIAARFELFIAGMELSNGFNELNDPFDQAERFKEQAQIRAQGDDEAMYYDANFIRALEYAMPPAVGVGIGIDRLVMLLTNTTSIRDVILFPTLKRKQD